MKSRLARKIMKHRFAPWSAGKDRSSYYYLFGNMKLKNLNPYWSEQWRVYSDNNVYPEKVDNRIIQATKMYMWSIPCCKWMRARRRRQEKIMEQRRKEYEQ